MTVPYRIYIPTRGRVGNQLTLSRLPTWLHEFVVLVCPKDEVEAHTSLHPNVGVLGQPKRIDSIAAKRGWIAEIAAKGDEEFWFQMDDDLNLFVWNGEKHTALRHDEKATNHFFKKTLVSLTQSYPCVGFGTKGFALPGGVKNSYHLGFVFGFSKELAKDIVWDRVGLYEDVDYTLQVLKSGRENAITYDVVVEQRKAAAAGGLTGERTTELIEQACNKLMALHPGLISKKPPSGKHEMSNIKVSWAKAAALGKVKDHRSLF